MYNTHRVCHHIMSEMAGTLLFLPWKSVNTKRARTQLFYTCVSFTEQRIDMQYVTV